ncbi:MAG: class I SAM-dependent methyltransferase [Ruminococcaceae bacterium]|nr:class I SAM-dependent methyltransferase [Oscillospiraceae bacterium]
MESYSQFAYVYDSLMRDVDYKARAEYLLKLFKKHGKVPTLLLDLACGTGAFSNLFAKKGIEVIGVDKSEDMLSIARKNSAEQGNDVLFLCQRAEQLDLYGTVDGAICCLDSLNHITSLRELKKAMASVSLFLEKDCLFIFDVNTVYKHEKVLADNVFVKENDGVFCVWQNRYDKRKKQTEIMLDFFVEKEGTCERFSESFCERAYTAEEIEKVLKASGFSVEAVYSDMKNTPAKSDDERIIFVAKKL